MLDTETQLLDAFATALRKRRLALNLSQEEMAAQAGVSMRYISLLESRRHQPSLKTIQKLCAVMGMTMAAFIAEVEAALPESRQA
jgi:transcriptional regulator with XRE-family HTH domain